jgi:hypothetical protein
MVVMVITTLVGPVYGCHGNFYLVGPVHCHTLHWTLLQLNYFMRNPHSA